MGTKDLQLPDTLEITGPDAGCYAVTGTGPYIWDITKGTIDANGCVNLTGQCGTATIGVTDANGCMGTKELNLSAENCSSLTIVNENGTPATDTILRGGSKDYKTTGTCCENITWSVSGTSGSSKGSAAITSAGVLTAGSSACGTLIVTATCAGCGTSDTQDVRVTNSGNWGNGGEVCSNCNFGNTRQCSYGYTIVGNLRYYWTRNCTAPAPPNPACTNMVVDLSGGSWSCGPCGEHIGLIYNCGYVYREYWICP
ncbi:MAG: hypothetical protein WC855_09460 [Thermodesulfovibrionales bacterium]